MNFLKNQYKDMIYYEIENFDSEKVDTIFTSRIGFNNENLEKNISEIMNISIDKIVKLKQVHGTELLVIDSYEKFKNAVENTIEADGIITSLKGIVLITFHADCVPIFFLDKFKNIAALSHAGWRGTLENIGGKTVERMVKEFGSNPKDILIGIGPSIGPCCYEVGKEVYDMFNKKYDFIDEIFEIKDNEKIYLNLWQTNKLQLLEKGISEMNISISNLCTSCNNDIFYSYRKESGLGNRMAAAIKLKV